MKGEGVSFKLLRIHSVKLGSELSIPDYEITKRKIYFKMSMNVESVQM
jgi:hypothetical protein